MKDTAEIRNKRVLYNERANNNKHGLPFTKKGREIGVGPETQCFDCRSDQAVVDSIQSISAIHLEVH